MFLLQRAASVPHNEEMNALAPFRLKPTFSPRTWGRRDLSPWYTAADVPVLAHEPVGEAWLTGPDALVTTGPLQGETLATVARREGDALLGPNLALKEFPLLVKLLFPDEKLSVQVHPNDTEAQFIGESRGKTECWYILQAQPGATVACGLQPGVTPETLRAAIAQGTMEQLLRLIPVREGDMIFVDAGTVHAILPGVTILEIQQTSDITYRLYDYGRPRELHLDQGLVVSKMETRAGKVKSQPTAHGTRLIQEQYFTVDRFVLPPGESLHLEDAAGKPHCFIALTGRAEIQAHGSTTELQPGSAVVVPASVATLTIRASEDAEIIRAMP